MTADASIYAPLTNAAYRAPAVKQPIKSTKKPWRETPLVESANLSEAAGWYGALSFHLLLLSYSVNASMVCACHLIGHCCCSLPILDGSSPITNEILMYLWKYLNGERSPSPMHTQKALAPGFQRHMRRRTRKPPSNPHLPLSQRHGSLNRRSRIFLKLETLQPSGSFKSRGIGHYCQVALERSARPKAVHFYASSGGNAGLACVFAAKSLGCPSTVVVPLSTKPMMIAKIRAAGATQVIQEGKSLKEAIAHLQEVIMPEAQARSEEAVFVPPFDHENVWRGNQTVFEEVAKQMAEQGNGEADVMACSVGGGGLLIGMLQGMTEAGWGNTEVLAVETEGAHSLSESLKMGELVALDGISSQATSLGAVKVAERCFELAQRHEATGSLKSVVLSDAEAAMGCWRFADDEKSLIELACGVNLALCYGGRLDKALGRKVKPDDRVVIVVCGGSNVTTAMVEGWRQEYGYLDDRHTHEVIPSAKTGLAMDLPTYGVPIDQAAGMAGGMPIRV